MFKYTGIEIIKIKEALMNYLINRLGIDAEKRYNNTILYHGSYFDGLIDKTEAIKRLYYEKPNLQICIRTEKSLQQLYFEGSEVI